jgi:hypothetical protein
MWPKQDPTKEHGNWSGETRNKTIVNVAVNLNKLKPLFFTYATTLWSKPNESNKTFI